MSVPGLEFGFVSERNDQETLEILVKKSMDDGQFSVASPGRDEYQVRVKVFELWDEDGVDQRTKDLDVSGCADYKLVGRVWLVYGAAWRALGAGPLGVKCRVLSMQGDNIDGLSEKRTKGTSVQEYQDPSLSTSWEG